MIFQLKRRYHRGFSRTRKLANWEIPTIDGSRTEAVEQIHVRQYLDHKYPDVFYTTACSGVKLPIGVAKKLKALGYRAGTPDLMIFRKNKEFAGLFIEMKREKGGTVSPEQKEFIEYLNGEGYKAEVCYGYENAVKVIDDYFGEKESESRI